MSISRWLAVDREDNQTEVTLDAQSDDHQLATPLGDDEDPPLDDMDEDLLLEDDIPSDHGEDSPLSDGDDKPADDGNNGWR